MIKFLNSSKNWNRILDAARTTVNKEEGNKEPSSLWKYKLLIAEHSPIRKLKIEWKWLNLKYWTSCHFARHNKYGIEHFVSTQRTDRTNKDRDKKLQSDVVSHECEASAQAIINISRKRLCTQASKETREAWMEFLGRLYHIEQELANVCVRECIYRGFCPEMNPCGWSDTPAFEREIKRYRNLNKQIHDTED